MVVSNEEEIREHYGVDIAAPIGEPVMASASGQVVFSGWTTELGNLVIIYHGNEYFTYYGHNELILVKVYEKVKRGDVITLDGMATPNTTLTITSKIPPEIFLP